jgi:hypothetical protein
MVIEQHARPARGARKRADLLGWASAGDIAAVPDEVFRVVREAGLLGEGFEGGG